ncbi:unnamed protein product [Mytilus edulis]|uniref:Endonuclease/exonuclease/phosphatase domain-containing protein n=1 Tax=Mytilus edulis TaxID=6550 RepID=A0A8S3SY73_MYTED|nr:unnamed protein product [Mytilus edulis]
MDEMYIRMKETTANDKDTAIVEISEEVDAEEGVVKNPIETHLVKNNTISVDGYTWFGHNRIGIHIRAKAGSGGVGFLVRNDLMELFNVIVVEDSIDGISWLKFEDKLNLDNIFYACVVYLPPENSTRAVNVHEFLESLMSQMYTIPKGNQFYLCRDFNSRCGDLNDFVEGIDTLPERQVVDYKTNKYGSIFCEFLADINCCMLNGRNNSHNDYTYVSTRGLSVVDYCIVPYEMLKSFDSKANVASFKTKYGLGKVPYDWLNSESFISDIDRIICILEESEANQCDIDKTYESFVNSIKSEMSEKIPNKIIQISNGSSNKHRRIKKPWWSTELTDLWNEVCKSETMYLKTKSCHSKKQLRHLYCQNRKLFDKNVQQAKRRYWYKMQDDLTSSCDNPKEFWRKIGKIGIGAERQRNIPMEIKLEDGSVSTDPISVLNKWKNDFSSMLNVENCIQPSENVDSKDQDKCDYLLDCEITIRLFNVCYNTGKVPVLWAKGVIVPVPKCSSSDPRDPLSYRGITLAPATYKLYCGVLDCRLREKFDASDIIHNDQNGFERS